ncbi:MAG TPA: phosphoribosylglycinamide formyltransferase [Chitinophagaceae bacterium]|nr:phosphoribosylglycinamide formyltransferase [Chitinophagaceae bacterium]
MLDRLQKKWKVGPVRLLLIIMVFALGGSATGYLGRRLMPLFGIDSPWLYIPIYIIIITLIWPLMVIVVSIPFGQFAFFRSYIKKLGRRFSGRHRQPYHIAIFASGAGSNAQRIIEHFRQHPYIKVSLIACNKPGAGVLNIAAGHGIPVLMLEKERFFRGDSYVPSLKEAGIDLIVLAGFLWKVPQKLIDAYRNHIINIHPALLPKYGGKGLYGSFVHEAVLNAGEKESGITIHYVDEHYDHGDHIFQQKVAVDENDTPASLAEKIHKLEHEHFPKVIQQLIEKQNPS